MTIWLTGYMALVLFSALCPVALAHAQARASGTPSALHRNTITWTDSILTRAIAWSPAGGTRRLPTLVFSPGFGQTPAQYSVMLEGWASRGFVVIAIAHPVFQDPDNMELYDATGVIARELVRAIGHITRHQPSSGSPFARVDTARIGLVGHSVGGAAVALACATDDRCKAAMDLDGTIFGDIVHTGLKQPFFLLRQHIALGDTTSDPPRFYEKRDQASLHEDSVYAHTPTMYWLSVRNLDHMSFTDAALEPASIQRAQKRLGTKLSAGRTQDMTLRYVTDFFGTYLSGARRPATLDRSPYPGTELKWKRPAQ
jgi:pimeloyl-ACP methyl ester carboxylesterase